LKARPQRQYCGGGQWTCKKAGGGGNGGGGIVDKIVEDLAAKLKEIL
jgi:hypothetical protein